SMFRSSSGVRPRRSSSEPASSRSSTSGSSLVLVLVSGIGKHLLVNRGLFRRNHPAPEDQVNEDVRRRAVAWLSVLAVAATCAPRAWSPSEICGDRPVRPGTWAIVGLVG